MTLSAAQVGPDGLGDEFVAQPVRASEVAFRGAIWDVRRDRVDLGEAGEVTREYIEHPGAVAVVALRQHQGRDELILIKQYRHPVKATEWELPAGLLDVAGEAPHRAAERELAEEVDLHADRWHHLTDVFPSPGGLGEAIRVYLARDLHDVPPEQRHQRDGEELGMPLAWIDLDDAVTAVLSGRLTNALAQLGVLATAAARDRHWQTLRPVDIPFHAHPAYRQDTE